MAKIVLGMGSSHGPQLAMPPEQWVRRATADRGNPELWFRGQTYTFPELVEIRGAGRFASELSEEKARARFDACQRFSRLHPAQGINPRGRTRCGK